MRVASFLGITLLALQTATPATAGERPTLDALRAQLEAREDDRDVHFRTAMALAFENLALTTADPRVRQAALYEAASALSGVPEEFALQSRLARHYISEFPDTADADDLRQMRLHAAAWDSALLDDGIECVREWEQHGKLSPEEIESMKFLFAKVLLEADREPEARTLLVEALESARRREDKATTQTLKALLDAVDAEGIAFARLRLVGPAAKTFDISSLRGQVVVLYSWEAFNDRAERTASEVSGLAKKYGHRGLETLEVQEDGFDLCDGDCPNSPALSFNLPRHPTTDQENLLQQMLVPFTMVLDRNGRVFRCGLAGSALENAVKEALDRQ